MVIDETTVLKKPGHVKMYLNTIADSSIFLRIIRVHLLSITLNRGWRVRGVQPFWLDVTKVRETLLETTGRRFFTNCSISDEIDSPTINFSVFDSIAYDSVVSVAVI